MTETPAFDHLLHCVPDVTAAVTRYCAAGLPAHANRPFNGFHNGAWRPDVRYVEILTVGDAARVSPSPYGTAMAQWMPTIDRLLDDGGGAMNFALNVTDMDATVERLRDQGHELKDTTMTFGGSPVRFREVALREAPPWAPFFIAYDPPREELWANRPADSVDRGRYDLAGFVIATPDPVSSADWLGTVTGIEPEPDTPLVRLPGAEVHFEPGAADHITALLLSGEDPPATIIDGLELRTARLAVTVASPSPSPAAAARPVRERSGRPRTASTRRATPATPRRQRRSHAGHADRRTWSTVCRSPCRRPR